MAYVLNELKWQSLTALVNEIKTPQSFLKNRLFAPERTLSTETAEIGYYVGGRKMAPMVRVDGEGRMVSGVGKKFATVTLPNIRIKLPMTPSEVFFGRQPGSVIFPSTGEQLSQIQKAIARDAKELMNLIENREEWMAAMALRGTITYSVSDEEVFTITFPRKATHDVVASPTWDSTSSDPAADFHAAKKLINADTGLVVTDVILGGDAAAAFLANEKVQKQLDIRNYDVGQVTAVGQFDGQGALYLGRFAGVRVWEYARQVLDENDNSVDLIRPKYAEFVVMGPQNRFETLYGAIPDFEALQGRKFVGKRFSKSWMEKDPSVRQLLVHTRPLCVPMLPDSTVSMEVVS